jgi:3-keto-L-gulonate-6-phosphate decarboxylase
MAVATCIETPTKFARRVVAEGTAIPIGTILKLTDGNVAIASSANNDPFAGILWEEKTASDGITEVTVALNGRWSMTTTAAAIGIGVPVAVGGANAIRAAIEADVALGCELQARCLNAIGGGGGTAIVEFYY